MKYMAMTSTKIIRDFIDANIKEFDRTLLETKVNTSGN